MNKNRITECQHLFRLKENYICHHEFIHDEYPHKSLYDKQNPFHRRATYALINPHFVKKP